MESCAAPYACNMLSSGKSGRGEVGAMPTPEIPIERFTVFATGLDHPECLAFDRDGELWAGGEAGQIYRITPAGVVATVANLGGFCAGLAFSPAGELFVCNTSLGIVQVKPSGKFSVFASRVGERKLIC